MEWRKAKKFSEVGKWEEIYLIKHFLFSFLSFKHFILQKVTNFWPQFPWTHATPKCLEKLLLFRSWYSLIGNLHFLKEKRGTSWGLVGAPLLKNPNSQIHRARKISWEMFQIIWKLSLLVCQNFQVMSLKGQ